MVKEAMIDGVLCRAIHGGVEYKLPASMDGMQFMIWKDKNRKTVLSMLKITENEHSNTNRKRRKRP